MRPGWLILSSMTRMGGGCVAETPTLLHPLSFPAREAGPDSSSVVLTAEAPLALLDIRCRDKAALDAFLKTPVGLASPAVAARNTNAKASLTRLGPDWWQLRCEKRALADRLLKAADGTPVGVTDISDAYLAIGLSGPRARDVLAKAATVDLHPAAFPADAVARTPFGRVTVIITRMNADEPGAFDVVISRSNARFLWRWLADAAREYGYTLRPAPSE